MESNARGLVGKANGSANGQEKRRGSTSRSGHWVSCEVFRLLGMLDKMMGYPTAWRRQLDRLWPGSVHISGVHRTVVMLSQAFQVMV